MYSMWQAVQFIACHRALCCSASRHSTTLQMTPSPKWQFNNIAIQSCQVWGYISQLSILVFTPLMYYMHSNSIAGTQRYKETKASRLSHKSGFISLLYKYRESPVIQPSKIWRLFMDYLFVHWANKLPVFSFVSFLEFIKASEITRPRRQLWS